MRSRRLVLLTLSAIAAGALLFPALASATPEPAWSIRSLAVPTNFVPGDLANDYFYELTAANNGGDRTDGTDIVITDTLPAGLTVKSVDLFVRAGTVDINPGNSACDVVTDAEEVSTVTCTVTESGAVGDETEPAKIWPGEQIRAVVHVSTPPAISGSLQNQAAVSGGGAAAASVGSTNAASTALPGSDLAEFSADFTDEEGLTVTQAAAHPFAFTTSFGVNTVKAPPGSLAPLIPAAGDLKEIEVALPPGIAGNPTATTQCTGQDFNTPHAFSPRPGLNIFGNLCPNSSVVGFVVIQQVEGISLVSPVPLYNLVPPKGMPAQLGFQVAGAPIYINTKLRTGSDYGVTSYVKNTSEAKRVTAASITIWGNPSAAAHDRLRGTCLSTSGSFSLGECPAGIDEVKPFFRLPTSCSAALLTTMRFDTWVLPGTFAARGAGAPSPTGCNQVEFKPAIEAQPTTNVADSPSGLKVDLEIPQPQDTALGEADLRNVSVTLPNGLYVNPSSAAGLTGCSEAEVDLHGEGPANCPSSSKVGTVSIDTPLLDHPVPGAVYLADQGANPFSSLIAIYIAVNDPVSGIVIKLAGKIDLDPVTGQLTSTFIDNPQQPFERFHLEFFSGARAPLRTPASCGVHTTVTSMTPWSAPESGPPARPSDSFQIGSGPAGPCPSGALAPKLKAGLANPTAASYSPFSLRLTRDDATDELAALSVKTPKGLVAKLAGVPYCSDASIAQAAGRSAPGQGAMEAASPSCPDASVVGSTSAGAGAGPAPFYTGGKVYLAGPYKGAPLSLVAVIPAVAGPFDLGVVVNRIALRVDPETTQVTADSDPFPTILSGVPLDVRDIRVSLDRQGFTLAPTSCDPQMVEANVLGKSGASATAGNRFQVGGCGALKFAPGLKLKLKGGTRRGTYPALRAELKTRYGQANLSRLSLALPHSEFLAQEHIRTICTRVQFAAKACPKGSIYGKARAVTPLLAKPLEGPVYLRSSSNPLPDLVLALRGQIEVVAVGRIDSFNGGIRASFDAIPDAPVSKVVVEMRGGKKGLLVNSRNICKHTNRATVRMDGQNGKVQDLRPVLKDTCAKKKHKKHKRRSHK